MISNFPGLQIAPKKTMKKQKATEKARRQSGWERRWEVGKSELPAGMCREAGTRCGGREGGRAGVTGNAQDDNDGPLQVLVGFVVELALPFLLLVFVCSFLSVSRKMPLAV